MKIKYEDLYKYVGKPVLFRWVDEYRIPESVVSEWERSNIVIKFVTMINALEFYYFFNNEYLGLLSGLDERYGKIWYLEECPETFSNEGRKTCLQCSCATELRRDFSTFKVREFCPRCKI